MLSNYKINYSSLNYFSSLFLLMTCTYYPYMLMNWSKVERLPSYLGVLASIQNVFMVI